MVLPSLDNEDIVPNGDMPVDKYVQVDGLRLRYVEAGEGPPVLLLHGASLGSSADVFLRNLAPLAQAGFRAIAFDQPGFGLSDVPADLSAAYRRDAIPKFMDALGLPRAALIGHSQAGNPAVQLALAEPARYSHVIVLGTGSVLPPQGGKDAGAEAAVQQRLERRMAASEPTLDDTRKLLEANLFHRELITDAELALRHARSIGRPFQAFVARSEAAESAPPKAPKTPLWQRLTELKMPLLLIFGREDRGEAAKRAALLKETYPALDLHIVEGCKHLVPWDAADAFIALAIPFLKR
jgi:2-hydroxy-6-oxonona-2,4-dienedioate hydrolase/4,5:9,10-diseco-3-hydroxy-5,9,17-trioxoandrosta-1(10),2-diene-4-oate hydrolase